jgi:hypothetical protein
MLVLAFAGVARADDLTATSPHVQATVHVASSPDGRGRARDLEIVRNGQTLFDARPAPDGCVGQCAPTGVALADLDGDGEPEVLYHADTGGAHCCHIVQVYWLLADASGYLTITHDFRSAPFAIRDLDGDGRAEFVTSDLQFEAFRLGSANDALPLSILRYDRLRFTDVTRSYRGRLRREAGAFWRTYRSSRASTEGTWFASLMAWAADEYRLGHRAAVLRTLQVEARHGFLRGPVGSSSSLIRFLDRYLRKRGYA